MNRLTGRAFVLHVRDMPQPSNGLTTWSTTTITSQAIGTAAKNPSAALQPLRRRTVPEPVGCGHDQVGDDRAGEQHDRGVRHERQQAQVATGQDGRRGPIATS